MAFPLRRTVLCGWILPSMSWLMMLAAKKTDHDGGYGMENGTMEKRFDVVALRVMPSEEEVEALMNL